MYSAGVITVGSLRLLGPCSTKRISSPGFAAASRPAATQAIDRGWRVSRASYKLGSSRNAIPTVPPVKSIGCKTSIEAGRWTGLPPAKIMSTSFTSVMMAFFVESKSLDGGLQLELSGLKNQPTRPIPEVL